MHNAKMEPISYQHLCAGVDWGGNKLSSSNLKNSLSPVRVVMYINEMRPKMICSHSREFVDSYIHSVHSRLQDGGAGLNTAEFASTWVHVVVALPINSKRISQV